MAAKSKEYELTNSEGDEVKCVVSLFPAGAGLQMQIKLVNLLLPVIGAAGTLSSKDSEDNKDGLSIQEQLMRNPDILDKLAKALMKTLDEKRTLKLIMELLNGTRLDGKEVGQRAVFDVEFIGEYKLLFTVLKSVLEANFGSFFGEGGIGDLIQKYLPDLPSKTQDDN